MRKAGGEEVKLQGRGARARAWLRTRRLPEKEGEGEKRRQPPLLPPPQKEAGKKGEPSHRAQLGASEGATTAGAGICCIIIVQLAV